MRGVLKAAYMFIPFNTFTIDFQLGSLNYNKTKDLGQVVITLHNVVDTIQVQILCYFINLMFDNLVDVQFEFQTGERIKVQNMFYYIKLKNETGLRN